LRNGQPRRSLRCLRDDSEKTRALAPVELALRPAQQRHVALVGDEPGDRAEQRRLPGAVRADQRDPFPALHDGADVADDGPSAERHGHGVEFDRFHARPPRVRRTKAKNGAPKRAVITPIGTSAGASAVRATTSARIRNPAPTTNDSGSSPRYDVPTTSRIACGTMIPTNAMRPQTATAAAVPIVAAATSTSRVRRTSTPRLAASR